MPRNGRERNRIAYEYIHSTTKRSRGTSVLKSIAADQYHRLRPGQWLDDVMINEAITVLIHQTQAPNFHSRSSGWIVPCLQVSPPDPSLAPRWYRRQHLLPGFRLLIPFHHRTHWSLFLVLQDPQLILHLDSSVGCFPPGVVESAYSVLVDLLCGESWGESDEWDLLEVSCVQQTNNCDCGVHVILNAAAILDGDDPRQIRQFPPVSLDKRLSVTNLFLDHIRSFHR